eukprot:1331070-Pyramimonas_sp.AAC.1
MCVSFDKGRRQTCEPQTQVWRCCQHASGAEDAGQKHPSFVSPPMATGYPYRDYPRWPDLWGATRVAGGASVLAISWWLWFLSYGE